MKKLIYLLIFIPLVGMSQKHNNGKVYDKHPAIEIVDQFIKAYTTGDLETLKSLVSEDFRMANSMNNNPAYKGGDLATLIGQTTFIKNNFVDVSIENMGGAYSDAIEYKKEGTFVQTFQEFIAWDKSNGFKIRTPFNCIFVFNKESNKIRRFWFADNTAAWKKWNLSRETIKNGVIYKDHPYIGVVRKIYYHLEHGNLKGVFQDFSPNARIYDSNLLDKEYRTLEEHIQNVTNVFTQFEMISIDEVGYPDYIDYEGSGGVVFSWSLFTFKNKKTSEIKTMKVHSQISFNEEGKIIREDLYYNATKLN